MCVCSRAQTGGTSEDAISGALHLAFDTGSDWPGACIFSEAAGHPVVLSPQLWDNRLVPPGLAFNLGFETHTIVSHL